MTVSDALAKAAGEMIPFTSDPLIEGIVIGSTVTLCVCLLYYYTFLQTISQPTPLMYRFKTPDSGDDADDS